jgi:hypothetical protein
MTSDPPPTNTPKTIPSESAATPLNSSISISELYTLFLVFFFGTLSVIFSIYSHNVSELVPIFKGLNFQTTLPSYVEMISFFAFLICYIIVLYDFVKRGLKILILEWSPKLYEIIKTKYGKHPFIYKVTSFSLFVLILIAGIMFICVPHDKYIEETGKLVGEFVVVIAGTIVWGMLSPVLEPYFNKK